MSIFASACYNQQLCCKPALQSPCSAFCSLIVKLEIYGAQKLRVGKQDLWIITGSILVFWYFNVAILISNVHVLAALSFNAGGTQLATSWKMCIITTLGLAQTHKKKHKFKHVHTPFKHNTTLSDASIQFFQYLVHHFLFQFGWR